MKLLLLLFFFICYLRLNILLLFGFFFLLETWLRKLMSWLYGRLHFQGVDLLLFAFLADDAPVRILGK